MYMSVMSAMYTQTAYIMLFLINHNFQLISLQVITTFQMIIK